MDCALVCPDAAIPNTVHEVHDLLLTAVGRIEATPARRTACARPSTASPSAPGVTCGTRTSGRSRRWSPPRLRACVDPVMSTSSTAWSPSRDLPVARTRPFFDSPEKEQPGTGGLFAATIDPWKCTGCLECIDVCGPGALTVLEQDADVLAALQRFGFMSATRTRPTRFTRARHPGRRHQAAMLDHDNFYATTGGRWLPRLRRGHRDPARHVDLARDQRACRRAHLKELTAIVDRLYAKRATVEDEARAEAAERDHHDPRAAPLRAGGRPDRQRPGIHDHRELDRVQQRLRLDDAVQQLPGPWVNSLFQDAQPLAKGIFEGVAAQSVADVRALRVAESSSPTPTTQRCTTRRSRRCRGRHTVPLRC